MAEGHLLVRYHISCTVNVVIERISIAHRPQTLASADRVLHVAQGGLRDAVPVPPEDPHGIAA
jgi:hypothetical protein